MALKLRTPHFFETHSKIWSGKLVDFSQKKSEPTCFVKYKSADLNLTQKLQKKSFFMCILIRAT